MIWDPCCVSLLVATGAPKPILVTQFRAFEEAQVEECLLEVSVEEAPVEEAPVEEAPVEEALVDEIVEAITEEAHSLLKLKKHLPLKADPSLKRTLR
jgi:hypothetical protein